MKTLFDTSALVAAEAGQVLTLNRDDFVRIAPQWAGRIIEP